MLPAGQTRQCDRLKGDFNTSILADELVKGRLFKHNAITQDCRSQAVYSG